MRLVKKENGHSIAVYCPENNNSKKAAQRLFKEGRVNFMAKANYSHDSIMEKIVQTILDKIKLDLKIEELKKQSRSVK